MVIRGGPEGPLQVDNHAETGKNSECVDGTWMNVTSRQREAIVPADTWLDPQRTSYGYGYDFVLVPGKTRPRPWWGHLPPHFTFGGGIHSGEE